jgi:hypothetical protein
MLAWPSLCCATKLFAEHTEAIARLKSAMRHSDEFYSKWGDEHMRRFLFDIGYIDEFGAELDQPNVTRTPTRGRANRGPEVRTKTALTTRTIHCQLRLKTRSVHPLLATTWLPSLRNHESLNDCHRLHEPKGQEEHCPIEGFSPSSD